jgi:hypothetical protein
MLKREESLSKKTYFQASRSIRKILMKESLEIEMTMLEYQKELTSYRSLLRRRRIKTYSQLKTSTSRKLDSSVK